MRKILLSLLLCISLLTGGGLVAQNLTTVKMLQSTSVKDQGQSGTCWCFSVMSIIESEMMQRGIDEPDLSEMFIVRNIYLEKAKNYLLRQGFTRFSEGAFTHDLIPAIEKYGIVPQSVYPNTKQGNMINHSGLDTKLKQYLDDVLKIIPIKENWQEGYIAMLDKFFGKPPEKFEWMGKKYTPMTFASEVVQFNPDDYIGLTSFSHHPFYKSFNVEVPDNYSGGLFYNIPIQELIEAAEWAIMNEHTVGWDADVSNDYFDMTGGLAMVPVRIQEMSNPDASEIEYTQDYRQKLFENLTTQDDHLMHLVGLKKSANGKRFFYVKNSWGKIGIDKGFINVSETYFAINTITLVLNKKGLKPEIKQKLNIN